MNNDPPSTAGTPNADDIAEGMPLSPWPQPQPQKVTPAYCPRCGGVMDSSEPLCPHCRDSISLPTPDHWPGFVYSRAADFILAGGAIVSGIGCAATVLAAIGAFLSGNCGTAFVLCPLAFCVQLALVIVFLRVRRIEPP